MNNWKSVKSGIDGFFGNSIHSQIDILKLIYRLRITFYERQSIWCSTSSHIGTAIESYLFVFLDLNRRKLFHTPFAYTINITEYETRFSVIDKLTKVNCSARSAPKSTISSSKFAHFRNTSTTKLIPFNFDSLCWCCGASRRSNHCLHSPIRVTNSTKVLKFPWVHSNGTLIWS